jgi:hypothetical protein
VLDVAPVELLDAASRAGDLPGQDDFGAEGAGLHNPVDGRVARLAEVPATLEGVGQAIRDDAGVQVRFVDLLYVDLGVVEVEALLQFGGHLADVLPALADDHPGLLGLEDDLGPHRGLGDVHAAVARAAEFVREELVDLGALKSVLDELVFVSH